MTDRSHCRTLAAIHEWVPNLFATTDNRAMPLFALNLNDQFGLARHIGGNLQLFDDDRFVENCHPGLEHQAARGVRELMEVHELSAISTFLPIRATYYGNDGN